MSIFGLYLECNVGKLLCKITWIQSTQVACGSQSEFLYHVGDFPKECCLCSTQRVSRVRFG
jgi:hypothetical protein